MRFELPGWQPGPSDRDLERLSRHQLVVTTGRPDEQATASRLGLSVDALRALRVSLDALRR
ncbi:hypothetical protein [Deinococcus knuensis]|uniref:hypothetical protein n=1 Tax=Deinococcus knuensis TaxID=1837380 RepID=UPI00166B1586|nr:hypothetical protein [Deinococcus knuensis]